MKELIVAILRGLSFWIGPVFNAWKDPRKVRQVGGGEEVGDAVDEQLKEQLRDQVDSYHNDAPD